MSAPINDLVQAYLDNQLDPAALADFERRLLSEPALAEQVILQARDEAIITEWAHSQRALQPEVAPARRPRRRLAFGLAALTASLAVAALVILFRDNPAATASYAELEEVAGEVYIVGESGESTAAISGSRLKPGQGLRTGEAGSATVISDATRLELGADTTIRLAALAGQIKKVILEQGSVAADVIRQTESPMVLATQQGEAYLESKSSFMSMPEGTRIEAEMGPVRFRKKDGQSVRVPAGWYAVALPANSNPVVPRPMPRRQSKPRITIEEDSGPILTIALSPDGSVLAAGCADGTINLYNVEDGSLRRAVKAHRQQVRCLAFSPDGRWLASAGQDRKVQFTDPQTGEDLGTLTGYRGGIESLAISPDGSLLATGGQWREQSEIKVWDLATRQQLAHLDHHRQGATAVAFSPDGRLLASAGRDQLVYLLEVGSFATRATLVGHRAPVNTIAFSPDGMALVSGSRDRSVRVWDVAGGVQRSLFPAQPNPIRSLAFSSDGQVLAAADVNVRLYDWASGQEQLILKGHKRQISTVVISADGKLMATAGMDKTIRIWDVPEGMQPERQADPVPDAG